MLEQTSMLVVIGGLPGTGKTTISRPIAARRRATYLRIDAIEQALRSAGRSVEDVGSSGYVVANALAVLNLNNGQTVIVDCVNPVRESRDGWRRTAASAKVSLLEIEVVCSEPDEHRRRVEERMPDIEGLLLPTWQAVLDRVYAPWHEPHLVVDTARLTPDQAVSIVEGYMETEILLHRRR